MQKTILGLLDLVYFFLVISSSPTNLIILLIEITVIHLQFFQSPTQHLHLDM